ncbi:MAG TPA: hypothetical protein VI277_09200 [Candidatus Limnocylindria bacterium]
MRLGFLTGALAAGLVIAGLAALVIWVVTLITGSADAWGVAPWLIPAVAALATIATYVAEVIVERAAESRKRETGEPWAYREDG